MDNFQASVRHPREHNRSELVLVPRRFPSDSDSDGSFFVHDKAVLVDVHTTCKISVIGGADKFRTVLEIQPLTKAQCVAQTVCARGHWKMGFCKRTLQLEMTCRC